MAHQRQRPARGVYDWEGGAAATTRPSGPCLALPPPVLTPAGGPRRWPPSTALSTHRALHQRGTPAWRQRLPVAPPLPSARQCGGLSCPCESPSTAAAARLWVPPTSWPLPALPGDRRHLWVPHERPPPDIFFSSFSSFFFLFFSFFVFFSLVQRTGGGGAVDEGGRAGSRRCFSHPPSPRARRAPGRWTPLTRPRRRGRGHARRLSGGQ